MNDLIDRLAQWIVQDNAILFVGGNLRQRDRGPVSVQQIAEALARRIDYQRPDRSLPAVARDFEVLKGRAELIKVLGEELQQTHPGLSALDQIIADAVLPYSKVITTRFDQILEQTLVQFQKSYVLIVRDTDVPYFDESKITLIKVLGDINQPDSLVITEDDIDDFLDRLPTIGDVIRAFFATKTMIFLGYDLNSDVFKRIYRQVIRNLSAYHRPAYAVIPEPMDEVDARYWAGQNVNLLQQDPGDFLEALASAVKAAVRQPAPAVVNPLEGLAQPQLPPRPYKALDSFTAQDVAIFAGRAEESQRMTNRLLAHRLVLLYGESGSGKTSLLRAGVGPRLAQQRSLLAVSSPAPGEALEDRLRLGLVSAGRVAQLPSDEAPHLESLIRAWSGTLNGPIVLAVDQFESFFLAYTPVERQTAIVKLAGLVADRSLDLRLVLVVREDFLGWLQALELDLPGLLDVRFRLERLGREAARAAIEEPAVAFGVSWEPALVDTLLDDLYADGEGGVSPPQLQIVCDRLYQAMRELPGEAGGGEQRIHLELFQRLGGTQVILGDYLDQAVGAFPAEQQAALRRLLGALVSSAGVKLRLELDELSRAAEVDSALAESILRSLDRQRLVRRYEISAEAEMEPRSAYELAHDTLIVRIVRWLGDDFWAAQKARELIRQGQIGWQGRNRLLAPEDLRLVNAQAGRVNFSPQEQEFIYASAVAYDIHADWWAFELRAADRLQILLRIHDHEEAFVRQRVVATLKDYHGEIVDATLARTALMDPDEQVREAAVRAIAYLGDPSTATLHVDAITRIAAATVDPERRKVAEAALVNARDLNPGVQASLPESLRARVRRGVWVQRWRRGSAHIWTTTLRGLQGGFWGLGFGLGLFLGLADVFSRGQDSIRFQAILSLVIVGLPIAGLMGALSVGSGAFISTVLRSLQDRELPVRTWLLTALTSALMMGLGFVVFAFISPGAADSLRSLMAGVLIGMGLAGVATMPRRMNLLLRALLAAGVGMGLFILAERLGLVFNRFDFWWLLVMGAASGVGFTLGLPAGIVLGAQVDGSDPVT